MKGSYFRENIEYRITIQGESWLQSSQIEGTLQLRNHGTQAWTAPPSLRVRLTLGYEKKVKAKTNDAFEELQAADISQGAPLVLPAGGTSDALTWTFPLPVETRISDSTKSLYITYGSTELTEVGTFGALQLRILPHPWIEDLCSIVETNFRFPRRKVSAADDRTGTVEVKFDPPDAKAFSSLEHLIGEFRVVQEPNSPNPTQIDCSFTFHVNQVDALQAGLKLKKVKKTFTRELMPSDIVLKLNNRIKRDVFEGIFDSVLREASIGV